MSQRRRVVPSSLYLFFCLQPRSWRSKKSHWCCCSLVRGKRGVTHSAGVLLLVLVLVCSGLPMRAASVDWIEIVYRTKEEGGGSAFIARLLLWLWLFSGSSLYRTSGGLIDRLVTVSFLSYWFSNFSISFFDLSFLVFAFRSSFFAFHSYIMLTKLSSFIGYLCL